jgi:hypothetical protein
MSYKAADSKREEFRKYLEKAGVMDVLTKILVGLYEEPEKPNNALEFMKQHMGIAPPETADVEALKLEVSDLREKLERLTEENTELKLKMFQLSEYEQTSSAAAATGAAEQQQPPAES